MSLLALRAAVVSTIEANVSAFASVEAHGGRINLEEVKRIAMRQPAARVAVLSGQVERQGGVGVCDAQLAVFIICTGTSEAQRDAAALTLSQSVVHQVVANAWGYADARAPDRIRVDNLYSGSIDRNGFALWSVVWNQQIDLLDDLEDPSDFDDFNRLHVDTDLASRDGVNEDSFDVWLGGTLMSAYGHLNISASAATSIAVADTFQKAAGTTALNLANGFDSPIDGRLRHTAAFSRPVLVELSASVGVDGDAQVSLAIAKNGSVVASSTVQEDLTAAGGDEVLSTSLPLELDENDYVEAWVTADDTVNVTLSKMSLTVVAT